MRERDAETRALHASRRTRPQRLVRGKVPTLTFMVSLATDGTQSKAELKMHSLLVQSSSYTSPISLSISQNTR